MGRRTISVFSGILIEYHWWFIMRYRRHLSCLYDRGERLTSARFAALSALLSRHCCRVMGLTSR